MLLKIKANCFGKGTRLWRNSPPIWRRCCRALAAAQAIPAERREQDAVLDSKAAVLEQSFYRLLRMVNGISATEYLSEKSTLSLRDTDIVQLVSAVCEASGDLAEMLGIRLRFVCAMERCRRCRRSGTGALSAFIQRAEVYAEKWNGDGGAEKEREAVTALCGGHRLRYPIGADGAFV